MLRTAHIKLVALLHHPSDVTAPIADRVQIQQIVPLGPIHQLCLGCEALEELGFGKEPPQLFRSHHETRRSLFDFIAGSALNGFISGFDKPYAKRLMDGHPTPLLVQTRTLPATPQ